MRRTSTLQAAAAALGMLAGFATAPADRAPLEGEVTPHAVAVLWDAPTPGDVPAAGVQADDGGGRLAPAQPATRLAPVRARAPEGRPAPARRTAPRKRDGAPHPLMREMDLATFQAPKPECPRAAEHAAMRAAVAERNAAEAAQADRHAVHVAARAALTHES